MTGDDRALHLGLIVPKTNGINELTGMSVALGVEGVDVADTPAHEEKMTDLALGLKCGPSRASLISPPSAQMPPRQPRGNRPLRDGKNDVAKDGQ